MTIVWGFVRRTITDLVRPPLLKQWIWVLGFTAMMVINLLINIQFLKTEYPDPVRPDDLLLDIIPKTNAFITVGEILSGFEVIVVVYIFWTMRFRGAPKLIFLAMTMFWIRGYAILLTPLAQVQPPDLNYPDSHFIAQTFYHGMFFSGHTASAFIQAFYFKGHRLRPIIFLLASGQAFALIASHSHYSIDVFGGLFVAYFVTHFDFMRLVPPFLKEVRWMPWYVEDSTPIQAVAIPELVDSDRVNMSETEQGKYLIEA